MTTSSQNQNQTSNGNFNSFQNYSNNTGPYYPTQQPLNNIVGNVSGINYAPTGAQTSALGNLQSGANAIPNFGPSVSNVAQGYLNGQNNTGVQNAAMGASASLIPYLSPNYLNPYNNPAEQQLSNQIISQVNGTFAGSGRDMSPANSQADVAGLAPTLFNQYNQNVQQQQNAANSLSNIANAANQQYLANAGFGVNTANIAPSQYLAPGSAQLNAANLGYSTPLQNVAGVSNLLLPIAGLGSQTSGNSQNQGATSGLTNTNMQFTPSVLQDVLAIFGGGGSSPAGNFGNFIKPFMPVGGK